MENKKVELGKITVPEDKQNWMKHVTRDGTVFATPPGGRKYTDAERKTVDEAVKKVSASYVTKGKQLRDAESEAFKDLRKNPMDDKLRNTYAQAKAKREEFDTHRKAAEAKAKREAREKALK